MCLHDTPFIGVQLTRLLQDAVGNTDLAHIVHRRRQPDRVDEILVPVQEPGKLCAVQSDSSDVSPGFVVTITGGRDEPEDDLFLCLAQGAGGLPHPLL